MTELGIKPECDDGDEGPCEERLHDPPVAGRVEEGGGDPPPEDEGSESKEHQVVNEAMVPGKPRGLVLV